jgi:hypothetical protein
MDLPAKREAAITRREQEREQRDKQRALAIKQKLQKERSKRSQAVSTLTSSQRSLYERSREELVYAPFAPLPTTSQLLAEVVNLKESIAFIGAVDVETAAKAYGLKGPFQFTKLLNQDAINRRLKLMAGNFFFCVSSSPQYLIYRLTLKQGRSQARVAPGNFLAGYLRHGFQCGSRLAVSSRTGTSYSIHRRSLWTTTSRVRC